MDEDEDDDTPSPPVNVNSQVFWSLEEEAEYQPGDSPNYRRVIGLGRLDMQGCRQLADTSWLETCTSIEHLDLKMSKLTNVAHLSTNLCKLSLAESNQLVDISGLGGCVNLHTLDLNWCNQIVDVSALGGCVNLHTFNGRGETSSTATLRC